MRIIFCMLSSHDNNEKSGENTKSDNNNNNQMLSNQLCWDWNKKNKTELTYIVYDTG